MKILNKLIPSINTYDPRNPKLEWGKDLTAGAIELKNNTNFNIHAWYCLFSCENSFVIYKITELIDKDTLQKVLEKNAFIILDNTLEPFERVIDSIYENIVIKEGIPASQIILLTNMYDAKSRSETISKKLNQDQIRIFWYPVFEQDLRNALLYTVYKVTDKSKAPKTLEFKKYDKKFLYFNRRWRLHRPFLITLLYGRNLLDDGYISFGPCDNRDTWDHKWPELNHYFRNNPDMLQMFDQFKDVRLLPPLFLDTHELHINRAESTLDTNEYYENSYFSVVSETTFFTNEWYHSARFLSEKTFKAIAMKHPFILVSVPKSLEILRIMGYRTFSPMIDESYDNEPDDAKRMLMIVNEIERLSKLSEEELKKFLIDVKAICDYNYNVLLIKKKFIREL